MTTSIGPSVLINALCICDLKARRRDSVLEELVACAHGSGAIHAPDLLLEVLGLRERLGSTATGKTVALPNARSICVFEPRLVFGRSRRGIDWKAPDQIPVQLVFLVLSPGDHTLDCHHDLLNRIAAFARLQKNRARLLETASAPAAMTVLREVWA